MDLFTALCLINLNGRVSNLEQAQAYERQRQYELARAEQRARFEAGEPQKYVYNSRKPKAKKISETRPSPVYNVTRTFNAPPEQPAPLPKLELISEPTTSELEYQQILEECQRRKKEMDNES